MAIQEIPEYFSALSSIIDDGCEESQCGSIPLFPFLEEEKLEQVNSMQTLTSLHGQAKAEHVRPPDSNVEIHANHNIYI